MLAIVRAVGESVGLADAAVARMRDAMAHRGPDGAGLWRTGHAAMAHRRLAVIDPGDGGAQPMVSPDESLVLVYNGMLYNDAEVRARLESEGVRFRTACDTETVLWAVARWGAAAAVRLRGMYAFVLLDRSKRRLTAGRDPLGIKPLYLHRRVAGGAAEVILSSESQAILAHPEVSAEPDLAVVSAYLTTIRPECGSRTLFEGIETLRPGEWREWDLDRPDLPEEAASAGLWATVDAGEGDAEAVRAAVEGSVRAHLRSDRPLCALLSGGLDSSAVAMLAARGRSDRLHTYCAGAEGGAGGSADFAFAREVATALGTEHREVVLTREGFVEGWHEMVGRLGVPLSTPNEVAIHAVARDLRGRGHVVALSGEGADELFGGYETPMADAAAHAAGAGPWAGASPGVFHVLSNQWVPVDAKTAVLTGDALAAADGDRTLFEAYEADFEGLRASDPGAGVLDLHLRFHRRVNLANLLRRLDTATMLAGVEGRTPLADVAVAGLAERLPMRAKFRLGPPVETKRCLRAAFAGELPAGVVGRPKASFPLPFQEWVGGACGELFGSSFAAEVFSGALLEGVGRNPAGLWHLAWPAVNVAMWGRRWWG